MVSPPFFDDAGEALRLPGCRGRGHRVRCLTQSGAGSLDHVFTPIEIGRLTLPHRIVMGSMHLGLEGLEDAGRRLAAFYRERALGGAGLIVTGGWAVSADGAADGSYGVLGTEPGKAALAQVAAATEGTEAAIALQLFHAGRYALADSPGEIVAPSAVASRVSRVEPRALGEDEVWEVVAEFAAGARLAKELGFAAVEVMGSEGYLVDQFLSPVTNRREDSWGGDAEGRMRSGSRWPARCARPSEASSPSSSG